MKIRVAINGFGRVGRAFFKLAYPREEIEVVAINDLGEVENLAYLLKYDSVYGKSGLDVKGESGKLIVEGREIQFMSEKDPSRLPWKDLAIGVVVESTGVFDSYEKSKAHLDAGAKRVVISAPVKDEPPVGVMGATVLMGINEEKLKTCHISANASCTTNAGSPVIQILHERFGIEKALLNTVHGYTASQSLVDAPAKGDWRRGRAAGVNIVPSSTGAAIATTQVIKELEGKFDGVAIRVPVPTGSIADVTAVLKENTNPKAINELFREASRSERWNGILRVEDNPIVSSDIVGDTYASIIDSAMTRVVGGNLVKVLAWYDNEMGYAYTLVEHVIKAGQYTAQ